MLFEARDYGIHARRWSYNAFVSSMCLMFWRISVWYWEAKHLFISLWLYSPLLDLGRFFSFLIPYTAGRTPWRGDQHVAVPLPTQWTTRTQNKGAQTSMPEWDSNPWSRGSNERRQRFHALDCPATVIGHLFITEKILILVPVIIFSWPPQLKIPN
jgi:hypothetical protein